MAKHQALPKPLPGHIREKMDGMDSRPPVAKSPVRTPPELEKLIAARRSAKQPRG